MNIEQQKKEIQRICNKLLDEGKYKVIIGFISSGEGNGASPHFIREHSDVEMLKWDRYCMPNLAKYLLDIKEPAAIIAKPCDARAVSMYITEKQKARKDVFIIGVECPGMLDSDGKLLPACAECEIRTPPIYDELIEGDGFEKAEENRNKKEVENNKENEGRFERFEKELNKCILCFACRQACYACYCKTCFMDREMPDWLPGDPDMSTKMVFHLGRAIHLAGRCIGCGACENACPSGVSLRYLMKDLADYTKELYNYVPGMDPDEKPAMINYDTDDSEPGFLVHK
jgi:formate dehydrogenase (coenzyme F420) beta subunit